MKRKRKNKDTDEKDIQNDSAQCLDDMKKGSLWGRKRSDQRWVEKVIVKERPCDLSKIILGARTDSCFRSSVGMSDAKRHRECKMYEFRECCEGSARTNPCFRSFVVSHV